MINNDPQTEVVVSDAAQTAGTQNSDESTVRKPRRPRRSPKKAGANNDEAKLSIPEVSGAQPPCGQGSTEDIAARPLNDPHVPANHPRERGRPQNRQDSSIPASTGMMSARAEANPSIPESGSVPKPCGQGSTEDRSGVDAKVNEHRPGGANAGPRALAHSRSRGRDHARSRGRRKPPSHGIKIENTASTWWGKRWIDALAQLSSSYADRLSRGRKYAEAGRVHDLRIQSGHVTAHVTGSRPKPYQVRLRLRPIDKGAWQRSIAEMSKQAVFSASLLAGEMPHEIERAFEAAGCSLFPRAENDLQTKCTCPDWANPCKHVAATHFVLGDALDRDPFLLFELRGRTKDDVLSTLGGQRRSGNPHRKERTVTTEDRVSSVVPQRSEIRFYERLRADPDTLEFHIEPPQSPGALLRQLGPPPSWGLDQSFEVLLSPMLQAAGALAREIAVASNVDLSDLAQDDLASEELDEAADDNTADMDAADMNIPNDEDSARPGV